MNLSFAYMGRDFEGYGYAGRKLATALQDLYGVRALDLSAASPPDGGWKFDGRVVFFYLPEWYEYVKADSLVGFTMFEGDRLPRIRVGLVNDGVDACLVPSEWCRVGFFNSGVTVPLGVVPLGVDPADFPLVNRRGRTGTYRFLWNGTDDLRKGWDLAYQSFWKAFRGSSDVELILHFRDRLPDGCHFSDANVRQVVGILPRAEYVALLEEADCFVFPSRGEGWGLPPREAAATGLPVLATNYSGLAVDIDEWAQPIGVCKTRKMVYQGFGDRDIGWAEPCHRDLSELMLSCYTSREGAYLEGEAASRWLANHGTWEHAASRLMDAIEEVCGVD